MSPERWHQVKRVFEAAVSTPVWERGFKVKCLCEGDRQLEVEVCKLLAADERAGSFLQNSAFAAIKCLPFEENEEPNLTFRIGDVVSNRFEILRFLDKGGMGEVYEAWDSELQDKVALKTISPEIASNSSAIDRFKHEVKQARGISHPNICRVYDLFGHRSSSFQITWFLTMEFLQGKTLLDRVREHGTIPAEKAFELIEQMVAGLAAAHQRGIVHRDFKSSNVMLVEIDSEKTRAVITDFGLARTISAVRSVTAEPAGQGTPGYMAPEQQTGDEVGFAADQYALGIVICEMLTGERPVVKDSPQWSISLPDHGLTPRWQTVIRRCLEVRPEDRFRNVTEIIAGLDSRHRRRRTAWQVGAFSAFAVLAASMVFVASTRTGEDRLQGVTQLTASTDDSSDPSLSRDGSVVAYMSDRAQAGNLDVWAQRLPSGRPLRLTTNSAKDGDPSIAPDGRSVVFRSDRDGGGIYWSNTETIGEHLLVSGGRGPRFSPDGTRIAYWMGDEDRTVPSGQIYVLSLSGGPPVRVATDFRDARQPTWSPDGQYLLFTGCRSGEQPMPACSEWWVTSTDKDSPQKTGALTLLRSKGILPKGPIAGWVADYVFFCGRLGQTTSLWRLRLPEKSLLVTGAPEQLTSGYATNVTEASAPAGNGTIAFSRLDGALHIWRIDHATDPRATSISKVTGDAAYDISPYISHSGRWLAFSRGSETLHDIWVRDVSSGKESLFFASNVDKASPIVDDSGDLVVFEVRDKGTTAIFVDRRGEAPKIVCTACSKPTSWFNGNQAVLYRDGLPSKIKIVNLETRESTVAIDSVDASLSEAIWSPENEYVLFTAFNEGGKKQIFAVRFPRSTRVATGAWIPIGDKRGSNDRARWSGDGKTIFYRSTLDGFSCVWAQRFDPRSGRTKSRPFAVMHFHNTRLSPQTVTPQSFDLSAFGDSIYLNLGEISVSVWTGILNRREFGPAFKWYEW